MGYENHFYYVSPVVDDCPIESRDKLQPSSNVPQPPVQNVLRFFLVKKLRKDCHRKFLWNPLWPLDKPMTSPLDLGPWESMVNHKPRSNSLITSGQLSKSRALPKK